MRLHKEIILDKRKALEKKGVFETEVTLENEVGYQGKKKKSLVLKIIFSIIFFMAVCIAFDIFLDKNYKNTMERTGCYIQESVMEKTIQLENNFIESMHSIRALAYLYGPYVKDTEPDLKRLHELELNSQFDVIRFVDIYGMSHTSSGNLVYVGDRDYFLDAMKGEIGITDKLISRVTNEVVVGFYSPVFWEGKILGILIGYYQPEYLEKMLDTSFFGYEAECFLIDKKGDIVGHSSSFPAVENVLETFSDGKYVALEVQEELIEKMRQRSSFMFEVNGRKGASMACANVIDIKDWMLIQVFPSEAFHELMVQAKESGYLLLGLLGIIFFITFIIFIIVNIRAKKENKVLLEKEKEDIKKLEEARQKAEKANNAKSRFLTNMSHDIRTPMNGIVGYTNIALDHLDDNKILGECIGRIKTSCDHLHSIIDDILDMEAVESGEIKLEPTSCNIVKIIDNIKCILKNDIDRKNLILNVDTSSIVHENVVCDSQRLAQVLMNCLNNSVKFTNNGGTIKMTVIEQPTNGEGKCAFEFHVEDNGIGMSAEFLPTMFEPFTREQTSTASGLQGTGLGMPITKKLVELMNGSIGVTSDKGVGTKYILCFDFPLAIDAETGYYKMTQKPEETISDLVKKYNFRGKRVLLVEDQEMNQELAKELLTKVGFIVEVVTDGMIAVDAIIAKPIGTYDLILMDIQMPIMDGYETTRAIRVLEDERLNSIPIIAITANAFDTDKYLAMEAGMNGHIRKPIDVRDLYSTINLVLKGKVF